MITDINGTLCGRLESMTCSGQYSFESNKNYTLITDWEHPNVGDMIKQKDNGKWVLGCPGTVYLHGYHYHDKPKCHPWLQEQENKYPGFIEKVWRSIKGI